MVIHHREADLERFILLPNRSASWGQTRRMILVVIAAALLIATLFILRGAWLVVPFCGLGAALLCWALWYGNSRTCWQEVITLAPHQVSIARGRRHPVETITLERYGLHLHSHIPENDFYLPSLALRRHATDWTIGEMLNREDRIMLIRTLGRSLAVSR
ncbi:MAG: DUF2244 domain-containing protein [Alcanivorax sp.]|nr:DUF2244 domain-containing protein [Alcanivorax sp.]